MDFDQLLSDKKSKWKIWSVMIPLFAMLILFLFAILIPLYPDGEFEFNTFRIAYGKFVNRCCLMGSILILGVLADIGVYRFPFLLDESTTKKYWIQVRNTMWVFASLGLFLISEYMIMPQLSIPKNNYTGTMLGNSVILIVFAVLIIFAWSAVENHVYSKYLEHLNKNSSQGPNTASSTTSSQPIP
jgi:hypothetical protein